jgi:DUF4097 and DUF4098 domain-containing protein YvlB
MKTCISVLSFIILASFVAQAQDFDYSFKENYEVSVPAQLAILCSDGNLDIIPSNGNKIQVFYLVKKGNKLLKIDRKELEEEFRVDVVQTNNSVNISVRNKRENQLFNFDLTTNVHFKVYVPKQTSCDLRTSDGNISLEGLTSHQTCKTSDGNLDIINVTGNVKGGTSDGNITLKEIKGLVDVGTSDGNIELENIGGDVQASTSDGNIDLKKVKGDISVKTSDGYIGFKEISGSFKATTSDGNIKGSVVELKDELALKTSGGNIDVTIPNQLGLDLDIKGESIDVPFENFTGKFDDTSVRGKANGGGISVTLFASDGNVKLTY